jgi:hypothetical protein
MHLAGIEPTIPVFLRAKTFHAVDRAATVTGILSTCSALYHERHLYCNMHDCLRPLLSNGPRSAINSGDAC